MWHYFTSLANNNYKYKGKIIIQLLEWMIELFFEPVTAAIIGLGHHMKYRL